MRVKTIVNGKGEPQATEIAIPSNTLSYNLRFCYVLRVVRIYDGEKYK